MKAETVEVLALFDRDVRYLIPIFQRNYKWNRHEHWGTLWVDVRNVAEDILDFGEGPDLAEHFLGAVVCEQQAVFGRDAQAVSIIDGQQRLTTLQLLLAGAKRACEARSFEDVEYLTKLIENNAIVVKDRPAHRFKVWPNVADRAGFNQHWRRHLVRAVPSKRCATSKTSSSSGLTEEMSMIRSTTRTTPRRSVWRRSSPPSLDT